MKSPEIYLKELGTALPCVVDKESQAILDADHRIMVNWEFFFVSSEDALAAFKEAPHKYCGLITDPVDHHRFSPSSESPMRRAEDHVFYFSSMKTAKTFDENPAAYATPMIGMRTDME